MIDRIYHSNAPIFSIDYAVMEKPIILVIPSSFNGIWVHGQALMKHLKRITSKMQWAVMK
jgi:hypothetical protein